MFPFSLSLRLRFSLRFFSGYRDFAARRDQFTGYRYFLRIMPYVVIIIR